MTGGGRSRGRIAAPSLPASVYAIAAASALAVAFASSPLPRITPDSQVYLTGAESIAESLEYADCERAITEYAPGYPALLALLVAPGLDAPDAARVMTVAATALLVLLAAVLATSVGLGRRATTLVVLAVAVAPPTLRNGAAVWSEQVFAVLLAALLVVLVRGRGLEARLSWLVAAVAALSWALLLTRYSGLFVVPAILIAAWLGSRTLGRPLLRVAALGGVVLAVPSAWYLRDTRRWKRTAGRASGGGDSLVDALGQVPDGLSSLVLPVDVPVAVRVLVLIPLVVVAALALYPLRPAPTVLGAVVVSYLLGITYAATTTVLDPVDARLVSPVLVSGALLVALGATRVASPTESRLLRALRAYPVVVVAGVVAIAPGVTWYLHDADRELVVEFPVDCAEWPARYYSPEAAPTSALTASGPGG